MTKLARSTLTLAALLSASLLASAAPARADEEDRAREACREIARDRNWKEIDSDVRREGNDRIVIRMRGERGGDDRERRCVYNTRNNEARFDDR